MIIRAGTDLTTPLTAAVLSAVPVANASVASGTHNTMRGLAASLGMPITGAIPAAR